jgi:hypothetical protein
VRWYRAHALFNSLNQLWDEIVSFAAQEGMVIEESNDDVHSIIGKLVRLTSACRGAQANLDSENAQPSHFIGAFLSVRYQIEKVATQHQAAVQVFQAQITEFKLRHHAEYHLFLIFTIIDPALRFEIGRTYSSEQCQKAGPASDDCQTYTGGAHTGSLMANEQITTYWTAARPRNTMSPSGTEQKARSWN